MSLITMYTIDRRASQINPASSRVVPIYSREDALGAHNIVTQHFGIEKFWDKKLMKCIFLDNSELDWFEFDRNDHFAITHGVTLFGDRSLLFRASPEDFFLPVASTVRISSKVVNIFGESYSELDYSLICTKHKTDYSVVAMFNSDTFKYFVETSTNLGVSRHLSKVEVPRLQSML